MLPTLLGVAATQLPPLQQPSTALLLPALAASLAPLPPGPRIFIGKLSKETSEQDVKDHFMRFGFVLDVYLPRGVCVCRGGGCEYVWVGGGGGGGGRRRGGMGGDASVLTSTWCAKINRSSG
jgi:hypothetical protein